MKSNRGGAREGAGAKKLDDLCKRVTIGVTISPEARKRIMELKDKGVKIGKEFDKWVDALEVDDRSDFGKRKGHTQTFNCMVAPSTREKMKSCKGIINFSNEMEKMVFSIKA